MSRPQPDVLEDFKSEFGYFGPLLHGAVLRSRTASNPITPQHITQTQINQQTFITQSSPRPLQLGVSRLPFPSTPQVQPMRRPSSGLIQTNSANRFVIVNSNAQQRQTTPSHSPGFVRLPIGGQQTPQQNISKTYVVMPPN